MTSSLTNTTLILTHTIPHSFSHHTQFSHTIPPTPKQLPRDVGMDANFIGAHAITQQQNLPLRIWCLHRAKLAVCQLKWTNVRRKQRWRQCRTVWRQH